MTDRRPADRIALTRGDAVVRRADPTLRGLIDSITRDGRHASVTWDDDSGDDRIAISKLTRAPRRL